MNEATPRLLSILANQQGGAQGSYLGLTAVVALVAAGSFASLGDSTQAVLNNPVNSIPPDLDNQVFISTHNPTYAVGSTSFGGELTNFDSLEDCLAAAAQLPEDAYASAAETCEADFPDAGDDNSGVDDSDANGGGDDDTDKTDLEILNDCLADAAALPSDEYDVAAAACEATFLGDDADDFESGFGDDDTTTPGLGSNSQGGSTPTYGDTPALGSNGGGGWSFGDLFGGDGGSLLDMAGKIGSAVGRGFMGVLAGTGGAIMGGVAGIFNGEGFINGLKGGWSDGWSACQDGPVWSMECAGRAAVGVTAAAVVVGGAVFAGSALGITAAGVAGFAAKSLAAGAVYTFLVEPDTLVGAWQDVTSGSFSFPRTRAAIAENFRGCVDSPGGCMASIATGAAVYGAFRGVSAAFRGFVARPVAATIMKTGAPAQGIMRLPAMQALAPKLQEMKWLLKVPGFRAAARSAVGGPHVGYALKVGNRVGAERVASSAGTTTHIVNNSSNQANRLIAHHVNQANRSAIGTLGYARQNLSRSVVSDRAAAPVIASFDPKSGLLKSMIPGISPQPASWAGRMASNAFIGAPAFVGTHAILSATTGGLAKTGLSENFANWIDAQEAKTH